MTETVQTGLPKHSRLEEQNRRLKEVLEVILYIAAPGKPGFDDKVKQLDLVRATVHAAFTEVINRD